MLTRQLAGEDIVLYRLRDGRIRAIRPYCPHLGAHLGLGKVDGDDLVCPFHGAAVWGISPQDIDSHERFARKHRLGLPLLADAGEAVAAAYGITARGIGLRRSVFILDGDGIVRWRHIALAGVTFRRTETLVAQLAALS